MEHNKYSVNNGLTKEFYEIFWEELKITLLASVKFAYLNQALSTKNKNKQLLN